MSSAHPGSACGCGVGTLVMRLKALTVFHKFKTTACNTTLKHGQNNYWLHSFLTGRIQFNVLISCLAMKF